MLDGYRSGTDTAEGPHGAPAYTGSARDVRGRQKAIADESFLGVVADSFDGSWRAARDPTTPRNSGLREAFTVAALLGVVGGLWRRNRQRRLIRRTRHRRADR